jgi:hypothetical protein
MFEEFRNACRPETFGGLLPSGVKQIANVPHCPVLWVNPLDYPTFIRATDSLSVIVSRSLPEIYVQCFVFFLIAGNMAALIYML